MVLGLAGSGSAAVTNFAGPSLPADWFSAAWSPGGAVTVANGPLTVDGARAGTSALYTPGRSLQFTATFTGDAWQHIGFGTDFSAAPWAIFSTFAGDGNLYARIADDAGQIVNTPIPGSWFDAPHRFRIDWNASSVVFWIDDTIVASDAATFSSSLRPSVSDLNLGGGGISVASIEMFNSILRPDLTGPGLPDGWSSNLWADGGAVVVADGFVIDGASVGTTATYTAGVSLEITATFSGDPWQHIGFGTDYNAAPWAIFSTFNGDGQLYALTATESGQTINVPLGSGFIGGPHRFRIDWNTTSVTFWIDGNIVASNAATITSSLRPLFSDDNVGGGVLMVSTTELLQSTFNLNFASLPEGWFSGAYTASGSATLSSAGVTVDGAQVGTQTLFSPGASLQFIATIGGEAWEHLGFGTDFSAAPWAIFSTFDGDGQLYARTADGAGNFLDAPVPGSYFGQPHLFEIDWNATNIVFSIDGTVVATNPAAISTPMRALISDYNAGGTSITVESATTP